MGTGERDEEPNPKPEAFRARPWITWVGALVVLASTLCYAGATAGPFLFDDFGSIVKNPHVESLTPLAYALDAPEGTGADGRPLVALSLALNHAAGGYDVLGYHLVNIALHGLTALLLFAFVRRTVARLQDKAGAPASGRATLIATLVAALWTAHPVHTATLHHIIQRNGIMVALFYLGTLHAAARGFGSSRPGPWFVASTLACMLGAGCKEVIVTAPLVVLLYDRAFFSGSFREAWRRHGALYIGLAASWLVLAGILSTGSRSATAGFDVERCPPIDYLRTQTGALLLYMRRVFWPMDLVFDYGNYPIARSWSDVLVEGGVLAMLLASSLFGLLRNTTWGWIAASTFLILAPTSSFIPLSGAVVAEHRVYLASAGWIALAGMGIARGLRSIIGSTRRRTQVLVGLSALAFGGVFTLTLQRNRIFASGLGVWEDTVRKRPDNARAWGNYGSMLKRADRLDEAELAYRHAIEAVPRYFMPYVNLGNILLQRGDVAAAAPVYARAVELRPGNADVHYYLGMTRLQLGQQAQGASSLRMALARDLEGRLRTEARRELAWVLATTRDAQLRDGVEALRLAQKLTESGPARARRLQVLSAALAELRRFDEAQRVLRQALELPDSSAGVVASLRAQLDSYARGQPWRE